MNIYLIKIILIFQGLFFLSMLNVTQSWAIPTLQLHISNAEYDYENESWMSYANPFTLEVIGAISPANISSVQGLKLHIAVPEEWYLRSGGEVSISGPGHEYATSLTYNDGTPYGSPPEINGNPDRYPAYYQSVALPDMGFENTSLQTVYNWDPKEEDPGTDLGLIYEYSIAYSSEYIFGLHLDLTGYRDGKRPTFAPYSHNADAPGGSVPEPATFFLFGTGLIGLGGLGRKKLFRK